MPGYGKRKPFSPALDFILGIVHFVKLRMIEERESNRAVRQLGSEKCFMIFFALAWILVSVAPLGAQSPKPGLSGAPPASQSTNAPAQLPKTPEEIDRALMQIETRLTKVRDQAAAAAPEATAEELTERQRLFQQWVLALDSQSRGLRRLKEVRRLNQDRAAESQAWRGFTETPPYPLALVEGLRDALATQRLEAQTDEMVLSIADSSVERGAASLEESRKQLRLARDQAEATGVPDERRVWLLRLAESRVQSNEAMVESAETGRLITLETLSGLRQYLEFLERKLAAAQAQARFTKTDLDGVMAQLNDKREVLRSELSDAIASDAELRRALAAAREDLRLAQREPAGTPAGRLLDLRAALEAAQARAETSELKVELLRSSLDLADTTRVVWEDRFWATGDHTLTELRNKRQSYQDILKGLRQWRKFAELKLSAAAQASGESISVSTTNLTAVERASAGQIQAALEERVTLYQRGLTALTLVENLSERLTAELEEREARVSSAGKTRFLLDGIGSFSRGVWNAELYIAEASVIADGQKISVPRIITLGKVVIALGILLAGLMIAHWGRGVVRRTATRWFKAKARTAELVAKFVAGMVALIALFVAMASVRIPWTIFAFMGGALAISVGFGAQTLINNFISGIILLFERDIRVGDIVELDDQRGTVVNFGFRTSLLERDDSVEVLVPNSQFLEKKVVNWTLKDDLAQYKITVGVAYGSPPEKVSALINQAAAEHPRVMKNPAPIVLFEDFGDNALRFALAFWMRLLPGVDDDAVRSELRYKIHALFDEAGIVLAFPQRDVHLDSAHPLEVKLVGPSAAAPPNKAPSDSARQTPLRP